MEVEPKEGEFRRRREVSDARVREEREGNLCVEEHHAPLRISRTNATNEGDGRNHSPPIRSAAKEAWSAASTARPPGIVPMIRSVSAWAVWSDATRASGSLLCPIFTGPPAAD